MSTTTDCEQQPTGDLCKTTQGYQLYDTVDLDAIPNNKLRKVN